MTAYATDNSVVIRTVTLTANRTTNPYKEQQKEIHMISAFCIMQVLDYKYRQFHREFSLLLSTCSRKPCIVNDHQTSLIKQWSLHRGLTVCNGDLT